MPSMQNNILSNLSENEMLAKEEQIAQRGEQQGHNNQSQFFEADGKRYNIPSDKLEGFKKAFPKARQLSEKELSQIESDRATQSEKEGRAGITLPSVANIDKSAIKAQPVSLRST